MKEKSEKYYTKPDFVREIANRSGQHISTTSFFLDAILETLVEIIDEGSEIRINNFGTFYKNTVKPKRTKHFNGMMVMSRELSDIRFKMSDTAKERFNR